MGEADDLQPDFAFVVSDDQRGERLDKALAAQLEDLSRTHIQALIHDGLITVNGTPTKPAYRLEGGEEIVVRVPPPPPQDVQPENIQNILLGVLYEDTDLIAIDKPAGMVVHPSYGHTSGTLVNALLYYWPQVAQVGDEHRAGIVHRLDKDTSGVIVVAKTPQAHRALAAQFENRQTTKRYLALVEGNPPNATGRIEAPIGRDPHQRKRMAVTRDGREAITEFTVLEYYAEQALLEVFPKTGRTHQIRVHLAFIGHPVVGDEVYGYARQRIRLKRHFLHAADLTVFSPSTGQPLIFSAPLPMGLRNVLDKLPR